MDSAVVERMVSTVSVEVGLERKEVMNVKLVESGEVIVELGKDDGEGGD